MSNVKFANIARLMTTYNLELVTEIFPDNLKCVKCKLVLKDACQVPCGCRFCRVCINDLMTNGSEFCSGVSKDCGESVLSDFVTDYRANISITQLTVKCPQNGCVHECELTELEEHMRVCGRNSVTCPFHELGCKQDKLAAEEMSGHFQRENRSHCEILIGMITDINREMESHKREIEMLKKNDESRKMENEMLKHELLLKGKKIRSIMDQMGHMRNEIKSIKDEKADLVDRVRELSERINGEIDERRESVVREITNVIEDVDKQITALTGSNKDRLDRMIRSLKDDIRSINQNSIKSINGDINCIKSLMRSIQALAGVGQIDASCEWTIDEDVSNTGWSQGDKTIQYFTGVVYPYEYRLESWNYPDDELWIWLYIYPGTIDEHLPWPLSGKAAITVSDRGKHEMLQKVTMQCEISKPADNQYISTLFVFSHSSLIRIGLDLTNCVNVWCVIAPTCTGQ